MIIRKPYAVLIKYFTLIHFFMLVISSYILFKTFNVLDFFNEYVSTRQFIESETLVNDIIPLNMIVFSFLILILFVLIVVLFRKKDKPIVFYLASSIFYVVFISVCFISRGIINVIVFEGIDPRISRIVRDIWLIFVFAEIIVVAFNLIRALRFDIKKFNFGEDLSELQISDEDSEEIEITTKFDSDRIKMRAAMRREELKAFFLENKFVIILILIILIVVLPTTLIARNKMMNKRYIVGEVIDLDDFNFKVVDSFLTKKDLNGNVLFKENNSYLIVKFAIENLKEKERGITLNNMRLELNGNIYMPKTTYYEHFTDIGNGYNGNLISDELKEYIAVYVINDEDLVGDVVIRYADKIKVKNSQASAFYYRIVVNPKNLDENSKDMFYNLNDELIIDSYDVKFKITHYNIKDKFIYEVNNKSKYIVNNLGLVFYLNCEYESEYVQSFDDFISENVLISYKYDDIMYSEKLTNITPKNVESNQIYLAVNENIKDASEISLVFKTRNIKYIYKIK